MDAATAAVLAGVGSAAITGTLTFVGAVIPAKNASKDAKDANKIAREELQRARVDSARAWVVKLEDMCRSGHPRERVMGLTWLEFEKDKTQPDVAVQKLYISLYHEHIDPILRIVRRGVSLEEEIEFLPPLPGDVSEGDGEDGPETDTVNL